MVKSLLIGNLIEHSSNHVSVESVKILAKVCNHFSHPTLFSRIFYSTDALPFLQFFSVKKGAKMQTNFLLDGHSSTSASAHLLARAKIQTMKISLNYLRLGFFNLIGKAKYKKKGKCIELRLNEN